MARNKLPRVTDDRLDRLGRALVRAAAEQDAETEAVATSPFLYTRVRAAIHDRQAADRDGGWLALLAIARRAVPAMAFTAALAAALMFWFAWYGAQSAGQFGDGVVLVSDEVVYGARGASVESAVLAENGALSHDEILEMVVSRNGREANSR